MTDILQWVQCFATFVSTLATAYPAKVPELMAYMACIVRCHKDYEGPAWVLYDRAFRRRAEVTKDLNWSVVNTSLFNLCFGGRARRRAICQICLSEQHSADRCPRRVLAWGGTLAYSAAVHPDAAYGPVAASGQQVPYPPLQAQEICRLFNTKGGNRCRFQNCKFAHICSRCRAPGHGAAQCPVLGGSNTPGGKRPRVG